jgi:hypothetical protein
VVARFAAGFALSSLAPILLLVEPCDDEGGRQASNAAAGGIR